MERLEELRERVRAAEAGERQEVAETLREIARPRMAGTDGADEVARDLKQRFEGLGYELREMPFSFSALPGRFGVPLIGLLYIIGTGVAAWLVAADQPVSALVVLGGLVLLVGLLGALARPLIRRLPWGRIETANWLVHRPGGSPRFLVMAHRDTKSQLVPIVLRALAAGGALLAWIALLLLAVLGLTADIDMSGVAVVVGVVAGLLGVPLLLSWSGNRSPGALDNGSGLAVLLGMAARLQDDDEVAFLVTDGEEMGLAGAYAAARQIPPVEGIVNVDGIEDDGRFRIMERHGWPRRGSAPHLATSLFAAARLLDLPVERRDLPMGIHVDHIPFVEAKRPALTVMRGSSGALWRVHLAADDVSSTRGTGVADAVALIEGALKIRRTPFGSAEGVLGEGLTP